MTVETLKKDLQAGDDAAKPKDFPAMLTAWLPEIKRALPRHLNAERMARIALTAFRRTPKLAECNPRSVFAAVIQAAQLGLEPDTLGRSYLLPYKVNRKLPSGAWESHYECQFIPGWKGLVDLMNRSKEGSAWTGAVFEGDDLDYQLGDSPHIRHVPRGEDRVEKLTHVYAVGRVKDAAWPVLEVWPVAKVVKHRDRYNKVGDKHYSFENFEMYARKVALLQVLKYMPCSAELVTAMALNDAAEIGSQRIDLTDAIEGTWEDVTDHEDGAAEQEASSPVAGGVTKQPKQTGGKGVEALKDQVKKKEEGGKAAKPEGSVALRDNLIGRFGETKDTELLALTLDETRDYTWTKPDADAILAAYHAQLKKLEPGA